MRVNALIALLPTLAYAVPAPGASDSVPPPKDVTIKSYTYGGSGCPDKTATCVIDDDKTAMTCIFDHFSAWTGPGSTINDARKNCQINVALNIPKGYRFTIVDAWHKGTVYLEAGLSARMQTKYYFTQSPGAVCTITHSKSGPFFDDVNLHDTAAVESLAWSSCGTTANLNMNSDIAITPFSLQKAGYCQRDATDLTLTDKTLIKRYVFAYQKC